MPSITRSSKQDRATAAVREQRREEFRRRLLDATEQLMLDGASFTELSVERLAVAAGSSRATFYVYFKDKAHLLGDFAEQVLTEVADAVRGRWQQTCPLSLEELRSALTGVIVAFRKHQQILWAIAEVAYYTPEIDDIYRGLNDRNSAYCQQFLEREQAAGRLRQMDSEETAQVLTWMVERSCVQMLREPPGIADDRLANTLAEVIWATIHFDDRHAAQ